MNFQPPLQDFVGVLDDNDDNDDMILLILQFMVLLEQCNGHDIFIQSGKMLFLSICHKQASALDPHL